MWCFLSLALALWILLGASCYGNWSNFWLYGLKLNGYFQTLKMNTIFRRNVIHGTFSGVKMKYHSFAKTTLTHQQYLVIVIVYKNTNTSNMTLHIILSINQSIKLYLTIYKTPKILLLILFFSCYTFHCKLVTRIWCQI